MPVIRPGLQRRDLPWVSVKQFGAVGDGTTDDTAAIQAAADACAINAYDVGSGGPTLMFPEAIGYRVSSGVVVAAGVPVEMRNSSLLYSGAANITVLTLGEVSTRSFRCRYHGIDVRRDGNITRSDEADIGVRFINSLFCDIYLRGARDFAIGAQCNGVSPGEGFYYNTVRLGYFFGNKFNLDLKGGDGATTGWVNENLWLGGEFQGSAASVYDRYGVRIRKTHASSLYNDQNIFIKPSFEMNGSTGNDCIPFLVQHAQGLTVTNARFEGTESTKFAKIENDSRYIDIHVGHQQIDESFVEDLSTSKSVVLKSQKFNYSDAGRLIYQSGALGSRICKYDSTKHHIPGLNFYRQVSTSAINVSGPIVAISGVGVQLGATDAIARMIDTNRCKKFVISIDAPSASQPWIVVQAFDAGGTVLTSADGGHPYVSGPGFVWSSSWQGYARPDPISFERLFTVTSDVASVRIGIYNGIPRGFSLHAIGIANQFAATYSGYEDCMEGVNLGTAAPLDGTWAAGRRIYNVAPAAGGTTGWVCTTGGTPGTWKTFGAITA